MRAHPRARPNVYGMRLFQVGFRYTHGNRGAGTVVEVLADGVRVVRFDAGEVHRYRPQSQHKLAPVYEHAPTAAAHCDPAAEAAAAAAHAQSEAAMVVALEEEAAAEAEACRARALEGEFARQVARPFAERVRAHLVASLLERVPMELVRSSAAAERCAAFATESALTFGFDSEHMSEAVVYLLDQHRLSRRLARVPPSARKLLLRRKEVIYSTLLAMDEDGSGDVAEAEFLRHVVRLGLPLTGDDARDLFLAFDLDGDGVVRPERLETLLFGVSLSSEHRAALSATAKLRQRQWHGEAIEEYQMAHAERADHHFGERRPSAPPDGRGEGRSATLSALVPLAAFLGLVRTTSAASGSGGAAAGHAAGGAQPSSVASRKREAPSEAPEASGRARESG